MYKDVLNMGNTDNLIFLMDRGRNGLFFYKDKHIWTGQCTWKSNLTDPCFAVVVVVIREMLIKNIMGCFCAPIRKVKMKRDSTKCQAVCEASGIIVCS